MRILLAEDNPVSSHLLKKQVNGWGHEVVLAKNGQEAWDLFQQGSFPIVITDWIMPEMDGLDLIRRIRNSERGEYVFILLLTAKSEKEEIVEGMDAGADDFISKPFDSNELRVRLRAGQRIVELEQALSARNEELESANQRMKSDLESAAKIQQALLPETLPSFGRFEFAWKFQPCDELAGDLLNVHQLDDDHVGVYLLDVSGHGVPAALLAVSLNRALTPLVERASILKQLTDQAPGYRIVPPAEVLERLNAQFQTDFRTRQYFTLLYGILRIPTGSFTYASAGHHGPVIISGRNGSQSLDSTGIPIGLMESARYEECVVTLNEGDRLYLFSDGIPEAKTPEGEAFEVDRLIDFLGKAQPTSLEQSVSNLVQSVNSWCGDAGPDDDVSCVAMGAIA